jgi:hypothetical protein
MCRNPRTAKTYKKFERLTMQEKKEFTDKDYE